MIFKEEDEITDKRAVRRERKKRPRMKVHGRGLKKSSTRSVEHIHKVSKKSK